MAKKIRIEQIGADPVLKADAEAGVNQEITWWSVERVWDAIKAHFFTVIVQVPGQETDKVMSQKAVTDYVRNEEIIIDAGDGLTGGGSFTVNQAYADTISLEVDTSIIATRQWVSTQIYGGWNASIDGNPSLHNIGKGQILTFKAGNNMSLNWDLVGGRKIVFNSTSGISPFVVVDAAADPGTGIIGNFLNPYNDLDEAVNALLNANPKGGNVFIINSSEEEFELHVEINVKTTLNFYVEEDSKVFFHEDIYLSSPIMMFNNGGEIEFATGKSLFYEGNITVHAQKFTGSIEAAHYRDPSSTKGVKIEIIINHYISDSVMYSGIYNGKFTYLKLVIEKLEILNGGFFMNGIVSDGADDYGVQADITLSHITVNPSTSTISLFNDVVGGSVVPEATANTKAVLNMKIGDIVTSGSKKLFLIDNVVQYCNINVEFINSVINNFAFFNPSFPLGIVNQVDIKITGNIINYFIDIETSLLGGSLPLRGMHLTFDGCIIKTQKQLFRINCYIQGTNNSPKHTIVTFNNTQIRQVSSEGIFRVDDAGSSGMQAIKDIGVIRFLGSNVFSSVGTYFFYYSIGMYADAADSFIINFGDIFHNSINENYTGGRSVKKAIDIFTHHLDQL